MRVSLCGWGCDFLFGFFAFLGGGRVFFCVWYGFCC